MAAFGFSLVFSNSRSPQNCLDSVERRGYLLVGWLSVVCGIVLLQLQVGSEFGLAYAFCGFSLMPLFLVVRNLQSRKSSVRRKVSATTLDFDTKRVLINSLHFMVAIPIGLISALSLSLLVSNSFATLAVNRMAFAVLVFPFFWATLAYLYFYSERRLRSSALIIIGTSVLCSFLLIST